MLQGVIGDTVDSLEHVGLRAVVGSEMAAPLRSWHSGGTHPALVTIHAQHSRATLRHHGPIRELHSFQGSNLVRGLIRRGLAVRFVTGLAIDGVEAGVHRAESRSGLGRVGPLDESVSRVAANARFPAGARG